MGLNKDRRPLIAATELRRHAEKQLCSSPGELHPLRTEEETQRLVHELEVHQIELETQNEELRRAQEEIESSRDKYAELYDFAPVAYFTFDTRGLIREVNLAGAKLLGIERGLLTDKPFISFIADAEGREIYSRHLESVLHRQGLQRCEIRLTGKGGTVIHGHLKSVILDNDGSKDDYILCSIVDGTVGKQLAEELQNAHHKLEVTVTERTRELTERTSELTNANVQLTQEIDERKKAEVSLHGAYAEIKLLKDRLQVENIYLQEEVAREHNFGEIIGQSTALSNVFLRVEQVAPMNATVLLLGETGTGKGVIARAIHNSSTPIFSILTGWLPISGLKSLPNSPGSRR